MLRIVTIRFKCGPSALWLAETAGRSGAVFAGGNIKFIQLQFIVFTHNVAFVHRDLKPVCARRVTGGCDEHPCRAVGVFGINGDIIFHFDIVPLAFMAKCLDFGRHAANPLPEVQIVRTLVEQNPAAFANPGCAPAAGIVIGLGAVPVSDNPVDAADFAEFPALNHFAQFAVKAVGALVVHNRVHFITFRGKLIGLPDIFCENPGGFFRQRMQAFVQRVHGIDRMEIMGCRDNDRVTGAGIHQFLRRIEAKYLRQRVFHRLKALGVDIRDRSQAHFLELTL